MPTRTEPKLEIYGLTRTLQILLRGCRLPAAVSAIQFTRHKSTRRMPNVADVIVPGKIPRTDRENAAAPEVQAYLHAKTERTVTVDRFCQSKGRERP